MTHPSARLSVAAFAFATAACLALSPASAQGTQEQQDACAPDAFKLCQNTIPDIPKTEACMRAHYAQLSPRCQHAFSDATGNDATGGSSQRPARDTARGETAPPPAPVARAPRDDDDDLGVAGLPSDPFGGLDGSDAAPRRAEAAPRGAAAAPAYEPYGSSTGPIGSYADQIRNECREGLIDPVTCSNTLAALRNAE